MSELKFNCVNNEEYKTVSINIENAIKMIIIFLIYIKLNTDIEREI